jgi:glyoxylase-like metal-dependent hydrolase (beta-lactamase superfamily II)
MAFIHTLPLGYVNSFLIQGDPGCILIDTGLQGKEKKLWMQLEKLEVSPEDIKLIIITHGHEDHTGGLSAVKQQTGAPVLCHEQEAEFLRNGSNPPVVPHTWFLKRLMGLVKETKVKPVEPDILIRDEFPLADYGIDGSVIHTPGHTSGSLAVILEGKSAIVGDTIMKLPLVSKGSYRPVIGQDLEQVYQSWQKILDMGVETIYTAHGKPLPAARIIKELPDPLKKS